MIRRALFRCDATPTLGGGHVMRCLALASAMVDAGYGVRFACAKGSMEVVPALARSGFDVIELADSLDPAELLERIETPVDALVFDHYGIDAAYERDLPCARTIVVIDDLADRPHDCDLLIDQTFGREAADYDHLVPSSALVMVGAQYALIRPEFAAARPAALARRRAGGPVRRILISMGLTDLGGVTAPVLEAVLRAPVDAAIDVVIGSSAPSRAAVMALADTEPRIEVHDETADLCRLMADADLAIGAAGTTSWERCCLGLPTVMLVLAANQRKIAAELQATGASVIAATVEDIAVLVDRLVVHPRQLEKMTAAAAPICDGLGASRVTAAIVGEGCADSSELSLHARPATVADAELLWLWRNDPCTRAAAREREPVLYSDHCAWLDRALVEPGRTLFVVETDNGAPVGTVRFDRNGDGAEISITVASDRRGRGFGRHILSTAIRRYKTHTRLSQLVAEVRTDNAASRRLFLGCGLTAIEAVEPGFDRFRLLLSD